MMYEQTKKRPFEITCLFNPAFCGKILHNFIISYFIEKKSGIPYCLLFLVLPIILHKTTRMKIPLNSRGKLLVWIINNPDVKIDFALKTKSLLSITKESLIFLLHYNLIKIAENGNIEPYNKLNKDIIKMNNNYSSEIEECFNKAKILGTWFARAGTESTIFFAWGVKP